MEAQSKLFGSHSSENALDSFLFSTKALFNNEDFLIEEANKAGFVDKKIECFDDYLKDDASDCSAPIFPELFAPQGPRDVELTPEQSTLTPSTVACTKPNTFFDENQSDPTVQSFELPAPIKLFSDPGLYNLRLSKSEYVGHRPTKGARHTYSTTLKKFFFNRNVSCPMTFLVDCASRRFNVAFTVLHKSIHHRNVPVQRCANHIKEAKLKSKENESSAHEFFSIKSGQGGESKRCERYIGHQSAIVEVEITEEGKFTLTSEFNCLSSCFGGNKGDLVFYLELLDGARVVGSFEVDALVCTCPGRSRKFQEDKFQGSNQHIPNYDLVVPVKRIRTSCRYSLLSPCATDESLETEVYKMKVSDGKGGSSSGGFVVELSLLNKAHKRKVKNFVDRLHGLSIIKVE